MFQAMINNFANNLDNLRGFIALVDAFLTSHQQTINKEKGMYIAPIMLAILKLHPDAFQGKKLSEKNLRDMFPGDVEISEVTEKDGSKSISLNLPENDDVDVIQALKDTIGSIKSREILYQGSLMTLTSSVEWFISQLVQHYYEKFPNAVGGKDNFFSLEDLKKFNDIKDAQQFLIDSKVEDLMRKSFSDWLKFLKDNMGLSMGYLKESEKFLIETFQRRHLVVHNGGVVNSIYLQKVDKYLIKDLKSGEHIKTEVDYLNNRIDLFELNCLLISLEAWKKQEESNKERAKLILRIVRNHSVAKHWTIAEGLSYFLIGDKRMGELERVEAQLYYWLSLKNQGKWSEIQSEVISADFSAKDKKLQLKYLAIIGNLDKAYAILEPALKSNDVAIKDVDSNPIFSSIREDSRYKKLSKKYLSAGKASKAAKSKRKPKTSKT